MRPYAVFDMHCDTLTKYCDLEYVFQTLDYSGCVLQLSNIPKDVHWAQFYACFIPERFRGEAAIDIYEMEHLKFIRQMEKYSDRIVQCRNAADMENAWKDGKTAAFFTIENGSAIAGRVERIAKLKADGVRCMTLTWNEENELASGNRTDHGLSPVGRKAVKEMEEQGILIDVSHLNDTGFWELMDIVSKPFVASHSNARAVCSHKRNLTDDMIREMIRRDCLIGLNYFVGFLSDEPEMAGPEDLYAHIAHFFELGAEKNLALGSDYDGCRLPQFLSAPEKVPEYCDYLLGRGLSQEQIDGIYWKNGLRFLRKNLK